MSEESNRVISNQIMYKQYNEFQPRYKYVRINMSNILSNKVPVTATGNQQVQFKLPYNTVYNISKSKISTLIPLAARAAGKYTYVTVDCWPFGNQSVSFETGNGLQLLNLTESSKYTKIVTKYNTSYRNYMTKDVSDMPHPLTSADNPSPLGTAGSDFLPENQYYSISAANTGAQNVPVYYELENFKHSILALNKDLYFGQNDMFLKYTVGASNNYAFEATNADTPVAGAATLTTAIGNLENVYLWLAVEQDPLIIQNIVSEYQSKGLRFLIDYPIITKSTAPASTNQSVVIPFVPANGKFLKRIYHTVWNSAESLNTLLDCENSATTASGNANTTAKVLSYNTYLDSLKLQDDIITCATATTDKAINQDDWRINQPFCRDSAILNYSIFQKNWAHIDDFCNPDQDKDVPSLQQNTREGLPMTHGIQYQFTANTASDNVAALSLIHVNFGIFLREVLVTSDGIQFI